MEFKSNEIDLQCMSICNCCCVDGRMYVHTVIVITQYTHAHIVCSITAQCELQLLYSTLCMSDIPRAICPLIHNVYGDYA